MPLRLYTDECVDGRVVAGLRRRGVDLVTANEQGLQSATDEQHMRRATDLGRVIVTSDRDFFAIVSGLVTKGASFPGLLFIHPQATVGEAVRALADAAQFIEPIGMQDRIAWIP